MACNVFVHMLRHTCTHPVSFFPFCSICPYVFSYALWPSWFVLFFALSFLPSLVFEVICCAWAVLFQRAELMARNMDPQQYTEFCEARQANFSTW